MPENMNQALVSVGITWRLLCFVFTHSNAVAGSSNSADFVTRLMIRFNRKWIAILSLIVALPLLWAYILKPFAEKLVHRFEKRMYATKSLRSARGTVLSKEHVRFDEHYRSYKNSNGTLIERPVGDEEWRIYYRIDDFLVGEDLKELGLSQEWLQSLDRKNIAVNGTHFTIVQKEVYDQTVAG